MNIKETYFGFTNKLSAMQKAKVEKVLDKLVRSNGVVMSQKEFIYKTLQEGYIPYIEYNYTYYKKNGELTKPKDDYRLSSENVHYTITKTEHDFAEYLIKHNLLDEQEANRYILEEQKQQEEIERLEREQLESEQQAREEKIRKEQEFKTWVANKANEYNKLQVIEAAKNIFLSQVGNHNEQYLRSLIVWIENIENPLCRDRLKEVLHRDNKASKKVFTLVTGIILPATDKGTFQILDTITLNDYQKAV